MCSIFLRRHSSTCPGFIRISNMRLMPLFQVPIEITYMSSLTSKIPECTWQQWLMGKWKDSHHETVGTQSCLCQGADNNMFVSSPYRVCSIYCKNAEWLLIFSVSISPLLEKQLPLHSNHVCPFLPESLFQAIPNVTCKVECITLNRWYTTNLASEHVNFW